MSVRQKQQVTRLDIRAPADRCPHCYAAVPSKQLLDHVRQRCPGQPGVHKHDSWIPWWRALDMGVSDTTLRRLTNDGTIRSRARNQGRGREYLEPDISRYLAKREPPQMTVRPGVKPCR